MNHHYQALELYIYESTESPEPEIENKKYKWFGCSFYLSLLCCDLLATTIAISGDNRNSGSFIPIYASKYKLRYLATL
jgi:hypothetical protein